MHKERSTVGFRSDRSYYMNTLRKAGQMIIDRADDFIGDVGCQSRVKIIIDLCPGEIPAIEVIRELFIPPEVEEF